MNFKGAMAFLAVTGLTVGMLAVPAGAGEPATVVLAPGSFVDDNGSVHEANIEALAAAGITHGCNPPDNNLYCPTAPTGRAEMATFLTRALDLPAATIDYFSDDDGSIHEANINALAAAGITHGCNPPDNDHYCPTTGTTRAQMASFVVRSLHLQQPAIWPLVLDGLADPVPGSSYAWHLAYGDLGYVAAGLVLAVNDDAVVWTSPDGIDWTSIPNTNHVFGGGAPGNQISISDVAVGNGAMVAVGASFDPPDPDSDAAVWRSTDRSTWVRVPHDESVFGDPDSDQRMNAVAFHRTNGFIAVGSEEYPPSDADAATEGVAVVWTSADGLAWVRVADDAGTLAGSRTQVMEDVVATSDLIVAAGIDYSTSTPAFWWSEDGQAWNRASDPTDLPTIDSLNITDVTAGSTGFVAIGFETTGEEQAPVAYTSPDGQSWTRYALATDGTMSGITYDGSGYIAVGSGSDGSNYPPAIWDSTDGITWQWIGERGSGPTSRWLHTVLATPAGLLVGGTQSPESRVYGSIWLRP